MGSKKLKRSRDRRHAIMHEVLTPTYTFTGFPVLQGDFVTVEYDDDNKTCTVRLIRQEDV